jgi:hypothetical protein
MSNKMDNIVKSILKEYEMLRNEIINSMNARNNILAFSYAIIGVMYSLSLTQDNRLTDLSSNLVLIIIVPTIAYFSTSIWIGEYERMQRAGKYIQKLESKLNNLLSNNNAMGWENFLRNEGLHMSYPYHAVIGSMGVLSLLAIVIGILNINFEY